MRGRLHARPKSHLIGDNLQHTREPSMQCAGSPAGSGAHERGVAGRAKPMSLRRAAGTGCQHPVIALAVRARGRDQRGQPLEQFQRRQPQLRAAIELGLGKTIDELVVSDLLEQLQREGPPRASCAAAVPDRRGPSLGS